VSTNHDEADLTHWLDVAYPVSQEAIDTFLRNFYHMCNGFVSSGSNNADAWIPWPWKELYQAGWITVTLSLLVRPTAAGYAAHDRLKRRS